jgi:hypothetical protein
MNNFMLSRHDFLFSSSFQKLEIKFYENIT